MAMKKIKKYPVTNLFTLPCFGFVIFYLITNFHTNRERLLFVASIILLYGLLLFFKNIFSNYFFDKLSLIESIRKNGIEIIVVTTALITIYFLGNLQLLGALLLGFVLFGLLVFIYYYLKH
jgi:hypothetical protein